MIFASGGTKKESLAAGALERVAELRVVHVTNKVARNVRFI